jgi:predicted porin
MKLKSSAIAVAVAGALGAPMAAQAESGFYADLRIGIESTDTLGNSQITIENQSSRFGWRGETDMGNGLTGFGRMEFGLNTEQAEQDTFNTVGNTSGTTNAGVINRRHAYVGLRGDWGEVKLGQTYHTFYTMITGPLDNPMLGTAGAWLGYTGRTNQGITYSGEWGIFKLGATGYFDDSSTDSSDEPNDLDLFELAGAFQAGPITLALGVATGQEELGVDVEPLYGVTASGWQTGMFTWGLGYTTQEDSANGPNDEASVVFDVLIGNGYFHYEQLTTKAGSLDGSDSTGTGLTLGYMQSLGRQTSMYYEYETIDTDVGLGNADKTENVTVALRYQWK